MSFAIIISEKGGQERREVFDKNEISIGRVQGNDLLLPKGNVSKRHARIVYRDGRFIVTDLKSTNGSYVNGHRIAQATIVREGDKIYIGDFILKVDPGSAAGVNISSIPREADGEEPRSPGETGAIPVPRGTMIEGSSAGRLPIPLPNPPDPVDEIPRDGAGPMVGAPMGGVQTRPPRPTVGAAMAIAAPIADRTSPRGVAALALGPTSPSAGRATGPTTAPPDRAAARPKDARAARGGKQASVALLLARLGQSVDLDDPESIAPSEATRSSIDRILRERARALQDEGEIPAGIPVDDVVREAAREALGTGPLGELLDDDEVVEIQVTHFHRVTVLREGGQVVPLDTAFSSDAGLKRAIVRLAHSAGHLVAPGDTTIDIGLVGGAHLTAIFPPVAASGTVAVLRKRRRADLSLDDLVRSATLSRAMASLLQYCLTAKANVLIAGPLGSGTTTLMGAMAAAGGVDERVLAIQEVDEVVLNQPQGATLLVPDTGAAGARVVRLATWLRPDRMLVGVMAGDIVGQVMEAIGGGQDGVIAAVRGPSLRQALARLVPALVASKPGLDPASARSWIASSFDLAVEVARVGTGHRVLRMTELEVEAGEIRPRPLFEFVLDPTATDGSEGSFEPSGVVPAVVTELKAQGHRVDESIFRRAPR